MVDLPDFVTGIADDSEDPRLELSHEEVRRMWKKQNSSDPSVKDRNEWVRTFFPGYEDLPGAAKKVFRRADGFEIKGGTAIPELRPWLFGKSAEVPVFEILRGAKGSIDPLGVRAVAGWGGRTITYEPVPLEEYIAWAEDLNFYTNGGRSPWGGPGLDPATFEGGAYDVGHYHPRRRDRGFRSPIVCNAGTYFGPVSPRDRNYMWGANSLFFNKGEYEPAYIGNQFETTDEVAIERAKAWL